MLYAGAAGLYLGTSIGAYLSPLFGWLMGAATLAFGLVYELYQQYQLEVDE